MFPQFLIGNWTVHTYPLMYSLAFLVAGMLCIRQVGQLGADGRKWQKGVLIILLAVLTGLFGLAWLENLARGWITGGPPEPVVIRVYYGLACGILATTLFARKEKLSVLPALDRLMSCFALGFAIARVGCLSAGCCGGAETESIFSMHMPDTEGHWAMRYPTQIASLLIQLGLFLFLIRTEALPAWLKPPGRVLFFYGFVFCLERFVLEFLRYDYRPIAASLSLPHWLMLLGMGVTGFLFLRSLVAQRALA